MSDARRDALVDAGRKAIASYLHNQAKVSIPSKEISLLPKKADRIASRIFEVR
jgi:hypothetical protein